MKGFWSAIKAKFGRPARPALESGDAGDPDAPYQVRETSPVSQLAVRVALWGLVGLGAVGGIVGMLRPAGSADAAPVVEGDGVAHASLPSPVVDVAEQAVTTWLLSDDDDSENEDELAGLFVEPPEPGGLNGPISVGEMTTLAGNQWQEGYWLVTLAVDVVECVPVESESDGVEDDEGASTEDEADEEPVGVDLDCPAVEDEETVVDGGDEESEQEASAPLEPQASTWFVEIGVVGELKDRVMALSTPSVLSEPPPLPEGWASAGAAVRTPEPDDDLANTAEEFLIGWLAGGGDPSRYLAPGAQEVTPADPAPFAALHMVGIAYQELEDGSVRARVVADATTPGGTTVPVSYELTMTYRGDRWEVLKNWGAPTLESRPLDEAAVDPEVTGE